MLAGRTSPGPWYLLSLLFILSLFAENRGRARIGVEDIGRLAILFVATSAVVNTRARALILLKLFLLSFLWYGLQAIPGGLVWWHGQLANEDGLGPLMASESALRTTWGSEPERRSGAI